MPLEIPSNPDPFRRLVDIMEALLHPTDGCPWDREQSHATLKPYVVEEAYEVCEAIDEGDMPELKKELGDLGLQIVFHSALARRSGNFNIDDVYTAVCEKLIRRHPHVFGSREVSGAGEVLKNWEAIKAEERAETNGGEKPVSALDGVPKALPALQRAQRLQNKAARVGFDWPDVAPVFAKIREEIDELEHEVQRGKVNQDAVAGELGDLLFAIVNLARFLKVDPEQAVQGTNHKFIRRFHYIEAKLRERGKTPAESTLEEMDAIWEESKKALKQKGAGTHG